MSFSAHEVDVLNSVLKGLVRSGEAREVAVQNTKTMDKLLLKDRRMRESLQRSAPSPEGVSPPDATGEGADV